MLADPLAGFRAVMDAAPASDKAVMDDPAWQRVFIEDVTEAFRPGAEGWADEGMALNLPWDFDPSDVGCSVTWWHGEHDANAPIAAVRRRAIERRALWMAEDAARELEDLALEACWRTVIAWWLLPPAVIGLLALSFQRAIRVA
jgi:hypothetical protein